MQSPSAEKQQRDRGPHLLVFDLYTTGHHPQYIFLLTEYWTHHISTGKLSIVVPKRMMDDHVWLDDYLNQQAGENVQLIPVHDAAQVEQSRRFGLLRNDLDHGRLLKRYIRLLQPDHCLLMYFDHVQVSLAFDLRCDTPISISGIYFRPSFHYDEVGTSRPDLKERLARLRKRVLLKAALRNRHMKVLYSLDPYVVPHIQASNKHIRAVSLPDGVEVTPTLGLAEEIRGRWGVEATRKVVLLFGILDHRKGLLQVIRAMRLLSSEVQRQTCFILAGPIKANEKAAADKAVQTVRAMTDVQIIVRDGYIPNEDVHSLIEASDIVLLTYQRHIGSSNVLIRAARAGVPVVGSNYGLVGEIIRRRKLGIAIDAGSSAEIASGVETYIHHPQLANFDADEARRYAEENTAEKFGEVIFGHILDE